MPLNTGILYDRGIVFSKPFPTLAFYLLVDIFLLRVVTAKLVPPGDPVMCHDWVARANQGQHICDQLSLQTLVLGKSNHETLGDLPWNMWMWQGKYMKVWFTLWYFWYFHGLLRKITIFLIGWWLHHWRICSSVGFFSPFLGLKTCSKTPANISSLMNQLCSFSLNIFYIRMFKGIHGSTWQNKLHPAPSTTVWPSIAACEQHGAQHLWQKHAKT